MAGAKEALAALVREAEQRAPPPGGIRIQVGSATCENAAGAGGVWEEFQKHVRAAGRDDVVLHRTGCTGRCSEEPIVGVFLPGRVPVKYGRVDRELVHEIFTRHVQGGSPLDHHLLDSTLEALSRFELLVCRSSRCGWERGERLEDALRSRLQSSGLGEQVDVVVTNCFGLCASDVMNRVNHVMVRPGKTMYRVADEADLDAIVREHLLAHHPVERLQVPDDAINERFFELYGDVSFFNRQTRIALRNSGIVDPTSLDEYLRFNGLEALAAVLERGDPAWVRQQIRASRLRGRGGGGYATGLKWDQAAGQEAEQRYLICNADEGDPGAFMDRSMLEGDPFSVLEGMIIGGYAVRASRGYLYIRAEYPLAVRRVEESIAALRGRGVLGERVLGTDFAFDLEVRLGAGAFVCGEETALIHSIEGYRGQPRIRPPYPTSSGLFGMPTVINNVETWANIPVIMDYGADWFARIGTERSGGTKVFALAGKVARTGLVEVPMGTTLREIVEDIGGGVPGGRRLKAVQTGGPAGGCIPAALLDTEVDFDSLQAAGSIMGSGGMIVLDEDDCVVDVARFFMEFSQDESCGKCTPCREGTTRMLEILDRITHGEGTLHDLEKLERLGRLMQKASLCGLGRAAPNPVLSTLHQFREEYLAHVVRPDDPLARCPARRCTAIIHYTINPEKCVGCTVCARNCPVSCIHGERRHVHAIDQDICIKCGRCADVCRFDAVDLS